GGYARTPLGEMLPVYVKPPTSERIDGAFKLRWTREGMLESWTRLRATERDEEVRISEMPSFRSLTVAGGVKPGAVVLAEALIGEESRPAVVTQRFGKGRSAAMMIGDLWQWSISRPEVERDDLATFWRQTLRWLVAETPRHTDVSIEEGQHGDGRVLLTATVRNAEFQADDDATVEFQVTDPNGETQKLTADPGDTEPGRYVAEYWATVSGGYRVSTRVVTHDNEVLLPRDAGWVQAPEEREFRDLAVQTDYLRQLAERSGGECVTPDSVAQFVETLPTRRVPVTEPWVAPLWHQAWVFACAVGCLCAEWGLRRWKGLS
ncbi:MAG: hypothetical protein KDB23_29545, partial [Planctomycetales bacterium]|nr:hypothetical protein [Planctomycetales bacterium]